jgi:maleate isomerase
MKVFWFFFLKKEQRFFLKKEAKTCIRSRCADMAHRLLIGMLTPSSNTVLEPVTTSILAGIPEASAHFGRFRVTEIALHDRALAQFATGELVQAASLLGDARCQVIAWNGTSAGWLGFEADHALCREIEAASGARACTSVLALNEVLAITGARRIGLVTPYLGDVQARIIATYATIGVTVVAESHLGLSENFAFSEVDEATIEAGIRAVAAARPDAIVVFCTNLRGAPLAAPMEAALGIPVYDTIATAVWKSLLLCGADPARIAGWGSLFAVRPLPAG